MNLKNVLAVRKQLETFLAPYKTLIGRSERMHNCQLYMSGLLLNGERKSIQPMAERLPGGNEQNLQQFVNQSPWDYKSVIKKLQETTTAWGGHSDGVLILDDTTLPKKGNESVGVAPQYCGALGKIANCQCVVGWHYATQKNHWPVNAELFLPESWRRKDRADNVLVPNESRKIETKWNLALKLLDEIRQVIPHRVVVFDAWYGESKEFMRELDQRKERFIGAIPRNHSFWPADVAVREQPNPNGRPRQYATVADSTVKPRTVEQWGKMLGDWTRIRLRTRKRDIVLAKVFRVREAMHGYWRRPGTERWLIIEKERSGRTNYYVSNFLAKASIEDMVLTVHERWKVEQGYQRLKEELGLDHFEGRSWRGLHHHITLCFLAYVFLLQLGKGVKKTALPFPSYGDGSIKSSPLDVVRDAEFGLGQSTALSFPWAGITATAFT